MNICFLDNNKISYDHNSLFDQNIRGAERAIINLALRLNKLGHNITVLNYVKKQSSYENIRFINIETYQDNSHYDLAITNNDINNATNLKILNLSRKASINKVDIIIKPKAVLSPVK